MGSQYNIRIVAKFGSRCAYCGSRVYRGTPVRFFPRYRSVVHAQCPDPHFEDSYYSRPVGKRYETFGRCLGCYLPIFCGFYVLVIGGDVITHHAACAKSMGWSHELQGFIHPTHSHCAA